MSNQQWMMLAVIVISTLVSIGLDVWKDRKKGTHLTLGEILPLLTAALAKVQEIITMQNPVYDELEKLVVSMVLEKVGELNLSEAEKSLLNEDMVSHLLRPWLKGLYEHLTQNNQTTQDSQATQDNQVPKDNQVTQDKQA